MIVEYMKVGPVECNCAIVVCPDTAEAIIVDPGGDEQKILDLIDKHNAKVKFILITHAHFDHVLAARRIKEATGALVFMHQKDMFLFRNMWVQYKMAGIKDKTPERPDVLLRGGERLWFGDMNLSVIHTPGHSPGSACYHLSDQDLLFSGDTLFRESVGNWQVPFGNLEDLFESITTKLMVLPDQTRVIPGHRDETTIGHEREHNPFLKKGIDELRKEEKERPGKLKIAWWIFLSLFKRK